MASRQCPVCCIRIVCKDPALAACVDCDRYFHRACLSVTGQLQRCNRCALKNLVTIDNSAAKDGDYSALIDAATARLSSPIDTEPAQPATHTAASHSSKRRASTPSPTLTSVPKAHCSSSSPVGTTALPAATAEEIDQGSGASAPYRCLDSGGSLKAALQEAPPYMRVFYDLLKTSHDSNATALADLRNAHTINAAALAENSRVLADTARTLSSLATRVNDVEQSSSLSKYPSRCRLGGGENNNLG